MANICIFCGQRPESKTNEHVIPEWLMDLTGNPNRKVRLGVDWNKREFREYAFDQFQFPSCDLCNAGFSAIENNVKKIVSKILNEAHLTLEEMEILLSWFDKVRIGLRLGLRLLNKDVYKVGVDEYIIHGIDKSDRLLFMFKSSETNVKRLSILNIDNYFFGHLPICFGLIINHFSFINASTPCLISRRIGLPYPTKVYFRNMDYFDYDMEPGLCRILTPLMNFHYHDRCTEIYQPIIPKEFLETPVGRNLYENNYVKQYFDISKSNKGKVFITHNNSVEPYEALPTNIWAPKPIDERYSLIKATQIETNKMRLKLLNNFPNAEKLDSAAQQNIKYRYDQISSYLNFVRKNIFNERFEGIDVIGDYH